MRTRILAAGFLLPLVLGAAPAYASNGADDSGCVSKGELGEVHHGQTPGKVRSTVGSRGSLERSTKVRGVRTVVRDYHACTGLADDKGHDEVRVRYNDRGHHGVLKVVSVQMHDSGDDNGVDGEPIHG